MAKLTKAVYLIKRQYDKKDGGHGYSMEIYVPEYDQSFRILTYKDDNKAYYALDMASQYIGNKSVKDFINDKEEKK